MADRAGSGGGAGRNNGRTAASRLRIDCRPVAGLRPYENTLGTHTEEQIKQIAALRRAQRHGRLGNDAADPGLAYPLSDSEFLHPDEADRRPAPPSNGNGDHHACGLDERMRRARSHFFSTCETAEFFAGRPKAQTNQELRVSKTWAFPGKHDKLERSSR